VHSKQASRNIANGQGCQRNNNLSGFLSVFRIDRKSMTDDDLESIIVTAGSAYSEGRYLEALELYEKAIVARPTNAILFANKAAILLRLDRLQEALVSARSAIELDPTWAKIWFQIIPSLQSPQPCKTN
ncbi:tetratricopeptide repeat protein, partial [Ostertagia ostertagi]